MTSRPPRRPRGHDPDDVDAGTFRVLFPLTLMVYIDSFVIPLGVVWEAIRSQRSSVCVVVMLCLCSLVLMG